MHIPDGFLDVKTWAGSWVAGAGLVGVAATRARAELGSGRAPVVGAMAAFVFAAQMVNFPVGVGTSGHLVGAALLAATLGPWTASLVMTTVLVLQALLFADGGLTALGANVLNMAFVGVFVAWGLYRLLVRVRVPRVWAIAAGAWLSVVAASVACALELALSGTAPLGPVLLAMAGWHALIGVGEAAITAGVVAYLARVRPQLVEGWCDR